MVSGEGVDGFDPLPQKNILLDQGKQNNRRRFQPVGDDEAGKEVEEGSGRIQ
jgi:hypothetical protein